MSTADLDAAAAIIDDARHAITGTRKVATTEAVLFSSDAARLVRERDDRLRIAAAGQSLWWWRTWGGSYVIRWDTRVAL